MSKFRVLKNGHTDPESTDIWKFVFHESYPTFKIANSGSQTITMNAGEYDVHHNIAHNLDYFPVYFAYILKGGVSMQVPYYISNTGVTVTGEFSDDAEPVSYYSFLDDSNTLRIGAELPYDNAKFNESFTIYWMIMLDEF